MTARSIGSATITFGLVSIPVNIYSTKGEERKLSFNRLHRDCPGPDRTVDADHPAPPPVQSASRLGQKLECKVCGNDVEDDQVIKGYEHATGQYVTFAESELAALEVTTDNLIALKEFIPVTEVDLLYVEKAYYLGAAEGAEQALATLYEALTTTERVGVATYAAKGRQSLVLVAPRLDASHAVLAMYELRYQHEVKRISEVPGDGRMPVTEHVQLAVALIEQEACNVLDLGKYADEVYERQLALVKRKVENGEAIAAPPPDAAPATPTDLMAALRASVKPIETPIGKVRIAPRARAERATAAAKKRTQAKKPKKAAARKATKNAVPSALHYAKRR